MSNPHLKEKRKIFNNSDREYVEVFKGKEYRIPPRGMIILPRREAVQFLGNYVHPEYDALGRVKKDKPLSWEKAPARMGRPSTYQKKEKPEEVTEDGHTCNACGAEFPNAKSLEDHLEVHEDQLIKEEDE